MSSEILELMLQKTSYDILLHGDRLPTRHSFFIDPAGPDRRGLPISAPPPVWAHWLDRLLLLGARMAIVRCVPAYEHVMFVHSPFDE